ncbi:MAG: dienelactone hydrolase family protein [Rhodospirillales bacterium]|nr:dienelactone hydrolase family protein [Rhodospirillales bacterium]
MSDFLPMSTITSEDGFTFEGYKVSPQGTSLGGVVILQEIFGVTDQLKTVAQFYADNGYTAIVPALFDRHTRGLVVPFDQGPTGREIALGLDPATVRKDVAAAAKAVDTGAGVSLVGFCWGGGQAYRLACSLELTSAVAFYGTALAKHMENNPEGPLCPMLFHFGETDELTPPAVIAAVREAAPAAEVHVYAAGHAFANDVRANYVEAAATLAKQRTLDFLKNHHGG